MACLRLIRDEPSVQDHCMGRGWLAFDSYEVTHAFRARWTHGGLPPAHLGRAVCPRPLHGQRVAAHWLTWGDPCVQSPVDMRWLAFDSLGTSRLSKTTAWAEGGWPLTHMRCPMCTETGGQMVACLWLIRDEPSVQDHCMGRRWLVFDSYEVTHVYIARRTDLGMPPA